MPQASPPQPSYMLEIVLATFVGATLGLLADNVVLGTAVGIALGVALCVIKVVRTEKRK